MNQELEKIVIPKKEKFRYLSALKSGSIKILQDSSIPIELGNLNKDHLPIIFDEITYTIQTNRMELDAKQKIYDELAEAVKESEKPRPELKQSAALDGLYQLLYQHTNDVLEDLAAYEKPSFNGRTKHDLIITRDRTQFELERIRFHANKFSKLFIKFIALGKSKEDFEGFPEILLGINDSANSLQSKLDGLYDLIIIARENLPATINFVHDEYMEPIFEAEELTHESR